MTNRSRGVSIAKRYPGVPCGLKGCGAIITGRKNANQRFCSRAHRELARKPRVR